ncbi:MAG: hypothetical protein HFP81_02605 [Methylococcales symbiont of Hymedesmia sp. n. MRB-2018]|nr:MAG: hypothetical protein HFP78_04445 [Methylococcales symbiont of Hymedesmia sp. n. MRB-2018]KAF3984364.1 MAG: hypothetical protein HFP81_02605 [Methylococcales symbiont of Hymedesmia sp. n. MRB-2018]
MIFGGLIAILTAIWIYRTAREEKLGNAFYWVAGSFVVYLTVQVLMINFNSMIVETFDTNVSVECDSVGGLNAIDNSDTSGIQLLQRKCLRAWKDNNEGDNSETAGIQSGTGGTFIGIIFELLPLVIPFLAIAFIRLKLILKQEFSIAALFSGIKEMFIAIGQSFKSAE